MSKNRIFFKLRVKRWDFLFILRKIKLVYNKEDFKSLKKMRFFWIIRGRRNYLRGEIRIKIKEKECFCLFVCLCKRERERDVEKSVKGYDFCFVGGEELDLFFIKNFFIIIIINF